MEILVMKNTMSEMKNLLDEINNRLDTKNEWTWSHNRNDLNWEDRGEKIKQK